MASSFVNGASKAHKFSKARALQPAATARASSQPFELIDGCMDDWATIWATHGCKSVPLPDGAEQWPQLPPIDGDDVRQVLLKFGEGTAVGPSRLAPRSLIRLSRWPRDYSRAFYEVRGPLYVARRAHHH